MSLSWLHISDFHFTGPSYDREVVLRSLVESVRWFRDNDGRKPDLIFATGDVAHSGKAKEYAAATTFFDALIDAAGIDKRHLFVVPGNHDVDRDEGFGLDRTLESREVADKYFNLNSPTKHSHKVRSFANWYNAYFENLRRFPENSTCGPVERVEVKGCKIGVLPLNSALFCCGDDDHEKLWLGRRPLEVAVAALSEHDTDLKIALVHHPLDWLHCIEKANIKASLSKSVDVLLRGHLHDTDVESSVGIGGPIINLTAGAAYQTRKYPNRAMYVTLEDGCLTVFPIRYVDGPEEAWVLDTALFPRLPGHVKTFEVPGGRGRCGGSPAGAVPHRGGDIDEAPAPPPVELGKDESAAVQQLREDAQARFGKLKQAIVAALDVDDAALKALAALFPTPDNEDSTTVVEWLVSLDFLVGKEVLLMAHAALKSARNAVGAATIIKVSRLLIPWLYVSGHEIDPVWERVVPGQTLLPIRAGSVTFAEIVMAGLDRREVNWETLADPDGFPGGAHARTIRQPEGGMTDTTEANLRDDLFGIVKAPWEAALLGDTEKDDAILRQLRFFLMQGIRVYLTFLVPKNSAARTRAVAMLDRIRARYPVLAIIDLDWELRGEHQDFFNEIRHLML
ncbi:MAG: metallophosphoesterase [Alphaproteobacteria bacterium]|nr:metallophosphoesterase [Alphaproteobacteria bacterium]